jgi:dUTP pyrophosphatase
MNVQIKRCGSYEGNLPSYATTGSAGMDLYAAIEEPLIIPAGGIVMVPTGIAIALPSGYECQVRSRSGLAAKSGIFALNAPGTIDSDYRGEIKVILANFGKQDYIVQSQERIAQIVIAEYAIVEWTPVDELTETKRGAGGFGSTGTI